MRRRLASLALVLTLLAPASALAQDGPPKQGRRGTHFIGEIAAGSYVHGAGGFAWGGMLGFGGKPRGVPARFYLVAGALRTGDATTRDTAGTRYVYDLQLTDVDFGLRVYFPIARGFRITTEALLGASLADAELRDPSGYRTHQNLSMPHLALGLGPQLRLIHELSFGVMARTMFVDTGNVRSTGPLSVWKEPLGRRTHVVGTMTFHW
ncbi:MAG: hypothetical protein ACOC1F_03230 [Myxococcota bacterium]